MPATRPYAPTDLDRAVVARALGERTGALLVHDDTVLFTASAPPEHAPASAVFDLLQAIHHAFVGRAHLVSRRRLLSTAAPSAFDREAVRLFGGKLCANVPARAGSLPPLRWRDLTAATEQAREGAQQKSALPTPTLPLTSEEALVSHAVALAEAPSTSAPLALRDRAVAALLVDDAGRVLCAARNTNGTNRTLHAEVNLLQRWWARHRSPVPAGTRVVTSLQPCRFCAELILKCAPQLTEVLYARPDPGRLARGTALERRGLIRHIPILSHDFKEQDR